VPTHGPRLTCRGGAGAARVRSPMLTPDDFRNAFDAGLEYGAYVRTGNPDQQSNWNASHEGVTLAFEQRELLGSFTRRINTLVSSGVWCGDCVQQCPMLDHIAAATPSTIALKFIDRDQHRSISDAIRICGGLRVPTVVFLNEDFEFVGLLGDRTLSRYRALARKDLGASCPVPGAVLPADTRTQTLQDWVNEFERVQLLLRLSPRLRERHGD